MPTVLAIAAHPDDIEFLMAGTLLLLKGAGWDVHYLNLSTGNLGSQTMTPARTAQVRRGEALAAAKRLGAAWHPPVCNDLEIFYDDRTLRRLAATVRAVNPSVILTHSPQDYMEDHMNTARLAVTAAFARGVPGYRTVPRRRAIASPVTVYHASPHGLRDGLESYRVCRRAHSERGWSPWDDPASIPRRYVSVPSGWSSTTPRASVAMGGDSVGRRETRDSHGIVAPLGAPGRARYRQRPGLTTDEREELKRAPARSLRTETRQRDLRKASAFFAQAELDRRAK
jgi:LmbE family N-acetylglucosaminyl deacetylase